MENHETAKLNEAEWLQIYRQIKDNNTYKFMYTDIDSYSEKISKMLNQDYRYHKNIMKKSEHNALLHDLKFNFMKIVNDLNMLDLTGLALCIQYVLDNLLDCLKDSFTGFVNCISMLNQEQISRQSKGLTEKCCDCQNSMQRVKLDSLMNSMTLGENRPSVQQLAGISSQLEQLTLSYGDIELSLMIDEVLQGKEAILNAKNSQINTIYEQIAQYLENIPQSTINMSRQNCKSPVEINTINISEQLEKGFNNMLRNPIRKLISRIFAYAKSLYHLKKQSKTEGTQTLLIKDEQNIKALLKEKEIIRKQLENYRKLKQDTEKDLIKMIDSQQKSELRISELICQNNFLEEKCTRFHKDLLDTKLMLESVESSKKQMSENLIKDYTAEKATFLKTIKELSIKIESATNEVKRLRRETQSGMISEAVQTDFSIFFMNVEVQTSNEAKGTSGFTSEIRTSMFDPSKKSLNTANKHGMFNRRSDFNETTTNDNVIQEENFSSKQQGEQKKSSFTQNLQKIAPVNNRKITKNKTSKRESIIQKLAEEKAKERLIENQASANPLKQNLQNKYQESQTNLHQLRYSRENLTLESRKAGSSRKERSSDKSNNLSRQIFGIKLNTSSSKRNSKGKFPSARMFMPQQHCSPYIGSQTCLNSTDRTPWLEQIELNNTKKQQQFRAKLEDQKQNTDKIQFFSKLFTKYEKLKTFGILERINEMVELNQFTDSERQSKRYLQDNKENSSNKSPFHLKYEAGKQEKGKNEYSLAIKKMPIKGKKQSKSSVNSLDSQLRSPRRNSDEHKYFTKSSALLLFDTEELMKKFECGQDIWAMIQNSIMIDCNFMNICDSIYKFFKKMESENLELYTEFTAFLVTPCQYLQKIRKEKQKEKQKNHSNINMNSTDGFKKGVNEVKRFSKLAQKNYHCRNQSQITNAYLKQILRQQAKVQPYEVRTIFHKILRFHKIIHRKCTHVEEFLMLIGFRAELVD